jgi:hypothetical protein
MEKIVMPKEISIACVIFMADKVEPAFALGTWVLAVLVSTLALLNLCGYLKA